MRLSDYEGPSVFGFETDGLRRAAAISVHTSPLATLGGKDAGGMNVYIRELSCHLARLGMPLDIFTRRTDPETPEIQAVCEGVNLISITAGPAAAVDKNDLFQYLPEFAEQAALYSLRAGVRYDVVHAHYWLSGWTAHLLKRYWDTPFVQMFHTTAHMKNAVSGSAHQESPLRTEIERKLVGLADSLIAANPDERADLVWRQRTPTGKICTIPPGVDIGLFQPQDRPAARAALGLPADRQVVLFVGRIDPIKGIETLVEAAGHINRPDGLGPMFVIVGGDLDADGRPTGPLANVVELAQSHGAADRFFFAGARPQQELPLFYSAADITVVPSRYESFGLVAVESMACGTPVVASRAGGLTFTIDDGETGLLVPHSDPAAFADAIAGLLGDVERRERMGHFARISAQRFAWESVAESVLRLYQRLAEGHRLNLCCDEEIFA